MAEPTLYQCTVCGNVIQSNGWQGHARSNAHVEAGGDVDSYVIFGEDEAKAADIASVLGVDEADVQAVLAENADLRAQIAQLEADNKRLDPLAAWPVWENADQVKEWFGEAHLRLIGEVELAADNRRRQRQGLPPLYSDNPGEYQRLVDQAVAKAVQGMIAEQTRWTGGVAEGKHLRMRTFKMIFPQRNCTDHDGPAERVCYRHGSMRQIPVESQINNGAASLNDPIERYKRKGAKPAAPVRCKLVDCYRPAHVGVDGGWSFGMYCSQDHQSYVEGAKQTSTSGNEMTIHTPTMVGA